MFDGLQKRMSSALSKIRGLSRISETDVDGVLAEIRTGLLEGDVHFRVTRDFLARVRERALREEVLKSLSPEQQILRILNDELVHILGGQNRELNLSSAPPAVVLMCGLQGSGKTTTTVKLAAHLKSLGKRPMVVSVDVSRPAAILQLKQLSERAEISVISSLATEKPLDIANRALKEAREQNADVLLVDTAGRLQVDEALMQELSNIHKALKPVEVLLVVDSMMGQQAVEVSEGFDRSVPLTGSILTKLDGDTRGGAALSIVAVTGKPIKLIGTGERPTDFEVFHPDRLASRILDMGDVLSLLEKAQKVITEEEAESAHQTLKKSDFSLEDFRDQMKMVSRMGSIGGLLKMLPGMGSIKEQLDSVDTDKEMSRINAMLNSMTPQERKKPDLINGTRRARIARGSGMDVSAVNQFLKRFNDARKLMKQMGKMSGMMKMLGGSGSGDGPGTGGGANPFSKRGGRGFGRKF